MSPRTIAATTLAACVLAACAGTGPGEAIGTVGGAVAGGVIGSGIGAGTGNIMATVAGAAIGGLIGNQIGRTMDREAQQRAYAAEYRALEYGTPGAAVAWEDDGSYGTVVPGPFYATAGYQRCREYMHTIYVNGQPQTARGVACRQTDGSWLPLN